MSKHSGFLPTDVKEALQQIGQNIRTARLRRNETQALLAERGGISTPTLQRLERGDPGISLAVLANVLVGLNLEHTLAEIASPDKDEVGKSLETIARRRRAKKGGEDELDTNF